MTGREISESIITDERAAKGDLDIRTRHNSFEKRDFISHAQSRYRPLIRLLVDEDVLPPHAEPNACRYLDMRRAYLAPVAHGFNRLYFSADEERGSGAGSLAEDYQKVRRILGRANDQAVMYASEMHTDAARLRDLARHCVTMLGDIRAAFRALDDAFEELDTERSK